MELDGFWLELSVQMARMRAWTLLRMLDGFCVDVDGGGIVAQRDVVGSLGV